MNPIRMSYMEGAIRTAIAFNEARNRHDIDNMMQLLHNDCALETARPAPEGTKYTGKDAISHFWHEFFNKSPNAHFKIEEVFGLGYRCVMRWRYSSSDSEIDEDFIRGVDVFQFKEDLIVEMLSYVKGTMK